MSKYEHLWKYIQKANNVTLKLSFDEIKEIIGFNMDHSFLTYKKEASQVGYHVGKISMKEKYVIFSKIEE